MSLLVLVTKSVAVHLVRVALRSGIDGKRFQVAVGVHLRGEEGVIVSKWALMGMMMMGVERGWVSLLMLWVALPFVVHEHVRHAVPGDSVRVRERGHACNVHKTTPTSNFFKIVFKTVPITFSWIDVLCHRICRVLFC
jgi:hypothetical protein